MTENATARSSSEQSASTARSTGATVYAALVGLTTLGILLQGLWAGIFLSYDDRPDKWVNVHARGADITVIIGILAFVAAAVWMRSRKDLLIGTGILAVALVLEAFLGGKITDDGDDKLTAVHVPLALLIMGLTVWLAFRSRSVRKAAGH